MTEEEREKLREKKKEISDYLGNINISNYRLREVDDRIDIYVREVISNPERHNLYEQLSVGRFFSLCDRYGLNVTEIWKFFTVYENLYFPGKKDLQRYKLTPVQAFQFANIFGFWEGKKRVTREAVLYVPRKFSKTTSCASLAIYDLLYGDANAECYTGANSADQAKKCFDVIRNCMFRLDPKQKRYTINKEIIESHRKDRIAFCQCLTANARTKDGLNASTVIMDEFSQAKDLDLLTVLTTSMGVRENPLTVIITTASDVFEGPFYFMLDGYKKLLMGDYEDDHVFAHIFEPDIDDPEDSPATWKKVHPHLGITVQDDFYEIEYNKAKRNGAEAMLAFRTKLLNVYSENEKRSWISASVAKDISVAMPFDRIIGRPDAMVSIDLSESDDFSAVTVGIYDHKRKGFDFRTEYFFPRGALAGHPNERLYRIWAENGHLQLTEGDVIDYRAIVEYIMKLSKIVKILKIGYDNWKSQECINMLGSSGGYEYLKPIRQTYGTFTAPVESFEHGAKTGKIRINDNPINWYCFGNAVLDTDKLENCKPIKRSQTQKIDGVITMLMCLRLFMDEER